MSCQIHPISIPNPFFEGRNTVYLLPENPITLIDTGVATQKSYDALVEGLRVLDIGPSDIRRVILTHKHIDHIGNAWRIQRAGGAEVLIHQSECKSLEQVDPTGQRFSGLVADRMATWGAPALPSKSSQSMPQWELEACEASPLSDGQRLELGQEAIEVLHTPGHTMGSICLQLGESLFSGDHVLPNMSPNVGAGDLRSKGLLAHYLDSLHRVRQLEGIAVTYPGHGEGFTSLVERCHELLAHHEQRLDRTLSILRERPASVYDVAVALFGTMTDFHLMLGCAEANAHLELLQERGLARWQEGRYHADANESHEEPADGAKPS